MFLFNHERFQGKYLQSANPPLAMSQMMAMSQFLPKKTNSTRNDDAFTYCAISLISANTLPQKYSGSLKSFMFYFIFILSGKWHPLWSSFQENDQIYSYV